MTFTLTAEPIRKMSSSPLDVFIKKKGLFSRVYILGFALQEGIYYADNQRPLNSFCVLFLRFKGNSNTEEIKYLLTQLWGMYNDLKNGIPQEFKENFQEPGSNFNQFAGNLSVLIGYGPKMFDLPGIKCPRPSYLHEKWLFNSPKPTGGGSIIDEVGLCFANDIKENPVANDHIAIQFIGDNEFVTSRCIVETWKLLRKSSRGSETNEVLDITSFFTGFSRPDNRSWLGFHDGVSNIRTEERLDAIRIDQNEVSHQDNWITNGTYLAFLRIEIDLDKWQDVPVVMQERIVGRNKVTGCPLIGFDKTTGRNLVAHGCPVPGTSEIMANGNDAFREHPPYNRTSNAYASASDDVLEKSHIGRMYKREVYFGQEPKPSRIFRQGYEFLEPIQNSAGFRVGLNFVSFQKSPEIFYDLLVNGLGNTDFGGTGEENQNNLQKLFCVRAAGIFIVPPVNPTEQFPGENIF